MKKFKYYPADGSKAKSWIGSHRMKYYLQIKTVMRKKKRDSMKSFHINVPLNMKHEFRRKTHRKQNGDC